MTVPEVKLIVLADQAATPIDAARSRTQPPKSTPADLRRTRVEEFMRSREISSNTRKAYERDLKQFMDWTDKGWHEISARDLDRYKNHLKVEPNQRGQLRKNATINRNLAALQSFFKWLTVRDYITKDPTLLLEKLKADPVLPQEFSQDEVDNLYQAICDRGFHTFRDRALLHLIDHGLRASEIHRLNVGDYDGQRIIIRVAKADSVGTVPLLKKARKAIDQYKQWREQQGDVLGNDSPLFVSHSNNSKGQRLQYWGIYKIFKAIADIAEVENAHPHRGRHTLATRLVMKDMDSVLARRITRHTSEQSFVRYSDRGIELKAEQEFYEVHGEVPGDGVAADKPESIQIEAIGE
ncbi:tyrosine-type recombinase/integrase [Acaryochloris marina]|uniref:Phage integrase n=1 Tax=Acaryochloris marina (strain MBIC 11017) TaxID=329726 RepID=A8ZPE4_ACAM1|nr:tyrosine-type recombinase/integrase [Acaryochloris marina]ABW32880.1 phage integrase [Acaryochloris marina MBIC11017]